MPSDDKDDDHRLFTPPREKDRPYLFAWTHARILAGLGLLAVAYRRVGDGATPQLAVVPRSLWNLDSYPDPLRSDTSYADGFKTKNDLRLVLRPSALRLMWSGILDLLVAGWPKDALAVLETGGEASSREDTLAEIEALCPAAGAAAPADTYCSSLRKAVLAWWPLRLPSSEAGSSEAGPSCAAGSSPDQDEGSDFRAARNTLTPSVLKGGARSLGRILPGGNSIRSCAQRIR